MSEEEREYLNEMIRSLNNRLIDALRERDEARRWICEEIAHQHETVWNDGERDFPPLLAVDVAISNGWDCFKEDGK